MSFWAVGAIVGGALITSSAAGDAADSQAASSANATAAQQHQYDQTRQDQMPWMDAGRQALGDLRTGIDTPLDPASVTLDPGYAFGLKQGQQAIDRKTAAAGGRISGAALKAAAEYGADYGSTKWTDAYNRINQTRSDRLNRLAALAGIGQTSAQQVGTNGLYTASGIANNMTAQGNATGASQLAQGSIWGNAGNQIASLYTRNSGSSSPSYNPSAYSTPTAGGDTYYGVGNNWGV